MFGRFVTRVQHLAGTIAGYGREIAGVVLGLMLLALLVWFMFLGWASFIVAGGLLLVAIGGYIAVRRSVTPAVLTVMQNAERRVLTVAAYILRFVVVVKFLQWLGSEGYLELFWMLLAVVLATLGARARGNLPALALLALAAVVMFFVGPLHTATPTTTTASPLTGNMLDAGLAAQGSLEYTGTAAVENDCSFTYNSGIPASEIKVDRATCTISIRFVGNAFTSVHTAQGLQAKGSPDGQWLVVTINPQYMGKVKVYIYVYIMGQTVKGNIPTAKGQFVVPQFRQLTSLS